jgi:hypothetical protein
VWRVEEILREPTAEDDSPIGKLRTLLCERDRESAEIEFIWLRHGLSTPNDKAPWIEACHALRAKGEISNHLFLYLVECFVLGDMVEPADADPEIERLEEELDQLEWEYIPAVEEEGAPRRLVRMWMMQMEELLRRRAALSVGLLRNLGYDRLARTIEDDPSGFVARVQEGSSQLWNDKVRFIRGYEDLFPEGRIPRQTASGDQRVVVHALRAFLRRRDACTLIPWLELRHAIIAAGAELEWVRAAKQLHGNYEITENVFIYLTGKLLRNLCLAAHETDPEWRKLQREVEHLSRPIRRYDISEFREPQTEEWKAAVSARDQRGVAIDAVVFRAVGLPEIAKLIEMDAGQYHRRFESGKIELFGQMRN